VVDSNKASNEASENNIALSLHPQHMSLSQPHPQQKPPLLSISRGN